MAGSNGCDSSTP